MVDLGGWSKAPPIMPLPPENAAPDRTCADGPAIGHPACAGPRGNVVLLPGQRFILGEGARVAVRPARPTEDAMSLWIDVRRRRRQPEIMDQPGLDRPQHWEALRSLARINRLSRSAGTLWPRIRSLARQGGMVRILDVASGGGDVPIRLWQLARHA